MYVKIKTTRDDDLEKIAGTARKYTGSRNRRKLIDRIYRQTKDPALEDARRKLVALIRQGRLEEAHRLEDIIRRKFPNAKYW